VIRVVAFFVLLSACTTESGSTWIDVTCGGGHACALAADGTVECWGKASDGQTNVPADTKFSTISAGDTHTCGIVEDIGTVACWGSNHLVGGSGESNPPEHGNFLAVSAGKGFTCGVESTTHHERCWGGAPTGGPNDEEDDTGVSQPPVELVAIDAGESHVCAITTDSTVVCWGADIGKESKTQPGSAHHDTGNDDTGTQAWPTGVTEIGAGRTHSCALVQDGDVECWGMGQDNQADSQKGSFVHLAVGAQHNCALDKEGSVTCWGDNGDDESDPPEGGGPYDRISAGDEFTCAIDREGAIVCWGNNDLDQSHPPG
jgi:alpha-tubulin suppressor-like RCC1 family protein